MIGAMTEVCFPWRALKDSDSAGSQFFICTAPRDFSTGSNPRLARYQG